MICVFVGADMEKYVIAGYVKLAKWWEKNRTAVTFYHQKYFEEQFAEFEEFELSEVFIDITGNKEVYRRSEMVRLLKLCLQGKINCIALQTRAYLAANLVEQFYLLNYIFDMPERVDLLSEDEDYPIDTIHDIDNQREELHKMVKSFIELEPERYERWKEHMDKVLMRQDEKNE